MLLLRPEERMRVLYSPKTDTGFPFGAIAQCGYCPDAYRLQCLTGDGWGRGLGVQAGEQTDSGLDMCMEAPNCHSQSVWSCQAMAHVTLSLSVGSVVFETVR